jgi:superoxide dismutase, Cu-Zn family
MRTTMLWILSTMFVSLISWGVDSGRAAEGRVAETPARAVAVLHPTEGNKVSGVVSFEGKDNSLEVVGEISGLTAGTKHGFHIHEYGDCSASNADSAGGHFNPGNMPHGGPQSDKRHVGDLGNVEADGNGNAKFRMVDSFMALEGHNSIVGRAVVVHAKPDDLATQPTGDAGARWACGVVGIAK